jgi:hypothetical protein
VIVLSKGEALPLQHYSYLKESGVHFALRGGDVIYPWGGNWFDPPYFKHVVHFFCRWRILPWFTVRVGRYGFYCGFKAFGVDSEHYLNWMPKEWVYDGSVCLHPSMRATGALN